MRNEMPAIIMRPGKSVYIYEDYTITYIEDEEIKRIIIIKENHKNDTREIQYIPIDNEI